MARGCVPLAGRRRTRVNVGFAFGDDTEFKRRANRHISAGADCRFEIIDRRLVEVRPGRNCGDLRSSRRVRMLCRPCALVEPRPLSDALRRAAGRSPARTPRRDAGAPR